MRSAACSSTNCNRDRVIFHRSWTSDLLPHAEWPVVLAAMLVYCPQQTEATNLRTVNDRVSTFLIRNVIYNNHYH